MKQKNVELKEGFWGNRFNLVKNKVLPHQWKALNGAISHQASSDAVGNFRIAAGESEGTFAGLYYQDSDVYKWLEAAGHVLARTKSAELEEITDGLISLIEKAQLDDGYLNTYFLVAEPDKKWTNLKDRHELYCAGHLLEAAAVYYRATGKRKILDVACRLADCIDAKFGPEEGKLQGYPGHQEIELALIKLYKLTGEDRYLRLSRFFVEERGQLPHFYEEEAKTRNEFEDRLKYSADNFIYKYNQSHLPFRKQTHAVGHSVRAMYYYSAIADLAVELQDPELEAVSKRLWRNVTQKHMYVTGALGAKADGEAFSLEYDLPNERSYTETCASIGLVFWARRMLQLELNGEYGDVMERALYNGTISGISAQGTEYFYVNPLEVWPELLQERRDHGHVRNERRGWFRCACCPTNIVRLLASLSDYVYSCGERQVITHLYTNSRASFDLEGTEILVSQDTDYPWKEKVLLTVETSKPLEFTYGLRIPGWCRKPQLKINGEAADLASLTKNGYALLTRNWEGRTELELLLPMPVERMVSKPEVRANFGKVAIQRGPVVYCLEEVDNGKNLHSICLAPEAKLQARFEEDLFNGVVVLEGEALRVTESSDNALYGQKAKRHTEPVQIKAVPYHIWANREPGEMLVWINERTL